MTAEWYQRSLFIQMYLFRLTLFSGFIYLIPTYVSFAQEEITNLYNAGDYEKVISLSSQAVNAGDTSYNTHFLKALSEIQLGKTNAAISTLKNTSSLFPEDRAIRRQLARQYFESGDYIKAKSLYQKLIQADSSDVASLLKLAEIASFTQKYKDAVALLEFVLVLDSTNLNGLLMLGEILTRQKNSSAIVFYNRAYNIYPENQKVAYALGSWYIQSKMPGKTIPICERILEKDSSSIKFQKQLGFAYYKTGDPVPSIKHFKKAIALGDSSVFTLKYLGISHYLTVNFQAAIDAFQVATKKDTMDAEIHFFLGASLGTTTRKEEAIYHLDQSLNLMKPDPKVTSRIYSELGNIMRLEMKYEEAYNLYDQAWENDTTNLMSLYFMASILDNSMRLSKEALVDYQRYIDQLDHLPAAKTIKGQIPTIRKIVEDRIVSLKEELFFLDEKENRE